MRLLFERTMLVAAGIAIGLAAARSPSLVPAAVEPPHRKPHATEIPADVAGRPHVIDGDTLDVGGVRVRLFGIDAPEHDQYCKRADGSRYACGDAARSALVAAVGDGDVTCTKRDVDPYGRMVGVCHSVRGDLGRTLVLEGAAIAYRHYSNDYVPDEEHARSEHAGLWQGTFEAPWDYRHNEHAAHRRDDHAAHGRDDRAAHGRDDHATFGATLHEPRHGRSR